MKKIFTFALTLVLLLSFTINAYAAVATPIEPRWDNTQSIVSSLDFDSTNSKAISRIVGKTGTVKIEATLTVYRNMSNDWLYINQTTASSESDYLSLYVRFTALKGGSYKSVLDVKVTNSNGVTETIQRETFGTN